MILFFDTSALVKFFHREEGTDVVVSLITDRGNRVWLSELARLEFACAVHRRYRMKEIEEDQLLTVNLEKILSAYYPDNKLILQG